MRTRTYARKARKARKARQTKRSQRGGSGTGVGGEACTKSWGLDFDNCLSGLACEEGRCEPNLTTDTAIYYTQINYKQGGLPNHLMRVPINSNGDTVLHLILEGNTKVVPELVRDVCRRSDVNARNKEGETPLLKAVLSDRVDLAQILLENGADVNARKDDSAPILHSIAIDLRQWSPRIPSKWYRYYYSKRREMVRLLFEAGINIDAQTDTGQTFLHAVAHLPVYEDMPDEERLARTREQTDLVNTILNENVNVNLQNGAGYTPLHYAFRNPSVVDLLLEAGCDPTIVNKKGETPLQMFNRIPGANPECIALLSEAEENILRRRGDNNE